MPIHSTFVLPPTSASALANQLAVGDLSEIWGTVPRKPISASRSRTLTPGAQLNVAFIQGGSNHSLPGTPSVAAEQEYDISSIFYQVILWLQEVSTPKQLPTNKLQIKSR